MDVVGVQHNEKYLSTIDDFLLSTYGRIPSLALEIAPWQNWAVEEGFFPELARRWDRRGSVIVCADIEKFDSTAYLAGLARQGRTDEGFMKFVEYCFREEIVFHAEMRRNLLCMIHYYFNILPGKRDGGMERAVAAASPDVVVLGRSHTDYLKRRLPSVHYVAFHNPAFVHDWPAKLPPVVSAEPYCPDRIVLL